MKPTIIVTHYLPHIGGLELATYYLAKELSKKDNDIHIITPSPNNKKRELDTKIKIHRHPVNTYPDEQKLWAFIDGILFFRRALRTIKEIQPDIIHSQNITNSIPAYIAWRKYHIPYVICIHGNLELMGPFLLKPLKRFWPKLPYIKSASEIISLTPEMGDRIEKELGRKSVVIPNGVDLERFFPIPKKNSNTENLTIITVSRIDDKKGLEYAIHSMPKILENYPKTKLKILGDGDYRSHLEQLTVALGLEKSVEFTGSIPNTEVPSHLQNAEIFLLPSLFEGLPLTLLESMACGLPVISTPVSVAPGIIEKWNNGIIVPFKSPDAIADAIITLLSNQNLREKYAKNSADAAKETMSWKSVAEQYNSLYQSVIESN